VLPPLGKIGGEKAIIPVRAALKDADKKVRSAAVRIGRSIGGKLPDDVGPAMEKALNLTKDGRTRRDAEGVLKKWQSQQKKK